MRSDLAAILDACVLVQAPIRDTLLRLFERRLFLARWSHEIMDEMTRTLQQKFACTPGQTEHLRGEIRAHFPDALVDKGYLKLIPSMTNHEKDRHVLAAAIKAGCEVIVTYNLKHFPAESLKPFGIEAKHPDEFLIGLYRANAEIVVQELHEQGRVLRMPRTLNEVLGWLEKCHCAQFAQLVRDALITSEFARRR